MLANVERFAHRGLTPAGGRAAGEDEDRTPRHAARAANGSDADSVARRGQVWASRPRTGPLVIDLDLFEGARRLLAADEVNAAVPRRGADTASRCRRGDGIGAISDHRPVDTSRRNDRAVALPAYPPNT